VLCTTDQLEKEIYVCNSEHNGDVSAQNKLNVNFLTFEATVDRDDDNGDSADYDDYYYYYYHHHHHHLLYAGYLYLYS